MVFTCYGRPHADVQPMLLEAAKKAAQANAYLCPSKLVKHWAHDIAVAIWKRNARMAAVCLAPLPTPEDSSPSTEVSGEGDEQTVPAWVWEASEAWHE